MGHSYGLWNVGHTQASVAEGQSRRKAKVWAAGVMSATREPVELGVTEEVRNRQKLQRRAKGLGVDGGDGGWRQILAQEPEGSVPDSYVSRRATWPLPGPPMSAEGARGGSQVGSQGL